jgi:hypothetical protein
VGLLPGKVKAGLVCLLAAEAVAIAASIDETRITRLEIVDIEAKRAQRLGTQAGQEHVGRFNQFEKRLAPFIRFQVERDALLAAVVLLHREVGRAYFAPIADDERAIGISDAWCFDLDDLGALVGQQHTGTWHEHVLRQLKNANT